jgi:hypothetical protein
MNNNERIADRIEEIISRMFEYFRSVESGATQYSVFYNPKKRASWFIIIFFGDKECLRNGLENGICYQIYNYISNELNKAVETSNIERSIFFELGNRPENQSEIDNLFELLLKRQESLNAVANKENIGECANCGHNFDKHQLLCNLQEDNTTPTEGWIICPEDDCNCFQTWSADYKTPIK